MRVTEIFFSLQGEGTRTGLPCAFVRFTGCDLRCVYCDTAYAFHGGTDRTRDEILAEVAVGTCAVARDLIPEDVLPSINGAIVSYSHRGSDEGPSPETVRRAIALIPDLLARRVQTGSRYASIRITGEVKFSAAISRRSAELYGMNGLAGGTNVITFSVTGTVNLASQLPDIINNLTITGPGADLLTIKGSGSSVVFTLPNNTTNAISGVTMTLATGTGNPMGTAATNSAGYYSFPNLPAGTYTVTPSYPTYSFTPPSRTVTIRGEPHSVMQAINRQVAHYAHHVGQIVMLEKAGSYMFPEEWIF